MPLGNPDRDRRTERHKATRAEIVGAAWTLSRDRGLAHVSLRELAAAVGMQPSSLYSYFASKNAIYDAMFVQGFEELERCEPVFDPSSGAAAFKRRFRAFLDFCTHDPARHQLLLQRSVPGFEPSTESMAVSERVLGRVYGSLAVDGVASEELCDLYAAVTLGLASQQIANDPREDRWLRLTDEGADMFLAHVKRRRPDD
jgi:AcrR family transcriptional regulator